MSISLSCSPAMMTTGIFKSAYRLRREDGEAYTLYTLSGVPREAFAKFPMPRNTAIFEPTFRGRGPVRSDDILADPRYGSRQAYLTGRFA